MEVTIKGNTYTIKELSQKWKLERKSGKVGLNVEVSKSDCPTIESLKEFLENSEV